jgi:hypothetical protein
LTDIGTKYSFELDTDMLKLIAQEFKPATIVSNFARAIEGKKGEEVEAIGKKIFEEYGRDWMKRTIQLSEEYPDRTYEVMKEAADKTGVLVFPHIAQRFLEIAYLSTHGLSTLPIVENNYQNLIYKMVDCQIWSNMKETCGEAIANLLPCRYACLAACQAVGQELGMDLMIEMNATMPKTDYCEFALRRV